MASTTAFSLLRLSHGRHFCRPFATAINARTATTTTAVIAGRSAGTLHSQINAALPRHTLNSMASLHSSTRLQAQEALDEATRQKIQKCVRSAPVVVFMKGTQQEPMCGFSRNVKLVLDLHHVPFQDFNVLEDETLRQGIKEFSDWPTIPQVYVNGEFVGGADIVVEMHKNGEIVKFMDEHGIPSRFSEKMPTADREEEKNGK